MLEEQSGNRGAEDKTTGKFGLVLPLHIKEEYMNEPKQPDIPSMPSKRNLKSVLLYWDDGTVDEIDQIEAWQTDTELESGKMKNWNHWKLTITGGKMTSKSKFEEPKLEKIINRTMIDPKIIKPCPYLLPCGICDRNEEICSQYQ